MRRNIFSEPKSNALARWAFAICCAIVLLTLVLFSVTADAQERQKHGVVCFSAADFHGVMEHGEMEHSGPLLSISGFTYLMYRGPKGRWAFVVANPVAKALCIIAGDLKPDVLPPKPAPTGGYGPKIGA